MNLNYNLPTEKLGHVSKFEDQSFFYSQVLRTMCT